MRRRLGAMVIGRSKAGVPITADDLGTSTLICVYVYIYMDSQNRYPLLAIRHTHFPPRHTA